MTPQTDTHIVAKEKTLLIKALAIAGFVATAVLIAWLLFQAIRLGPSVFSYFASIIESMEEYKNGSELTLATEKDVVNSDEPYTISFNKMRGEGEYTFQYICTDGVNANIVTEPDKTNIDCGEEISLPKESASVTIGFVSEKKRFTDISYTVSFRQNGKIISTKVGTVTVLNSNIPEHTGDNTTQIETTEKEVVSNVTSSTTTTVKPKPVPPKPVTQYVSIIPQSDPNGYTDFVIKYISPFVLRGNDRNSIVVEVKNSGTKTSDEWRLVIDLPNGYEYVSDNQDPLKPNEQATLTIEFEMDENDRNVIIHGEVKGNDVNKLNNSFSQFVAIN